MYICIYIDICIYIWYDYVSMYVYLHICMSICICKYMRGWSKFFSAGNDPSSPNMSFGETSSTPCLSQDPCWEIWMVFAIISLYKDVLINHVVFAYTPWSRWWLWPILWLELFKSDRLAVSELIAENKANLRAFSSHVSKSRSALVYCHPCPHLAKLVGLQFHD